MTSFAFYRASEHFFASLCEGRAEGAQATEGGQDKSDSLRRRWAVGLSLIVNALERGAKKPGSLSVSTSCFADTISLTSSAFRHDQ